MPTRRLQPRRQDTTPGHLNRTFRTCAKTLTPPYLREVGGGSKVHVALLEVDLALAVLVKYVGDEGKAGAQGANNDVIQNALQGAVQYGGRLRVSCRSIKSYISESS